MGATRPGLSWIQEAGELRQLIMKQGHFDRADHLPARLR